MSPQKLLAPTHHSVTCGVAVPTLSDVLDLVPRDQAVAPSGRQLQVRWAIGDIELRFEI